MDEMQKVIERYEKRRLSKKVENKLFSRYVQHEREMKYFEIINKSFYGLSDKILKPMGYENKSMIRDDQKAVEVLLSSYENNRAKTIDNFFDNDYV